MRYLDWPVTWQEKRYHRLVTKRTRDLEVCTVECAVRYREMLTAFEAKHGTKVPKRSQPSVRLVGGPGPPTTAKQRPSD